MFCVEIQGDPVATQLGTSSLLAGSKETYKRITYVYLRYFFRTFK